MKQYELTYLAPHELTEEAVKSLQDKVAGFIQAKNGTVTEFQKAYKRRLAYSVKNKDVAYVNTVVFSMDPNSMDALKKELKDEPLVLRSLLLTYKPFVEKPRRVRSKERQLEEKSQTAVEEKPARREKAKVELNDIEEKLEEILQDEKA